MCPPNFRSHCSQHCQKRKWWSLSEKERYSLENHTISLCSPWRKTFYQLKFCIGWKSSQAFSGMICVCCPCLVNRSSALLICEKQIQYQRLLKNTRQHRINVVGTLAQRANDNTAYGSTMNDKKCYKLICTVSYVTLRDIWQNRN